MAKRDIGSAIGGGMSMVMKYSMEGEKYYPELQLSKRSSHFGISTTRLDSDIPLSYFSWADINVQGPKNQNLHNFSEKAAVFLARNCHSRSDRETLVQNLMKLSSSVNSAVPIHSASDCLHNYDLPNHLRRGKNLSGSLNLKLKNRIMERYAFTLAFENQIVDDYITEKLWGALESGTIPVYLGAPNVKDHLPGENCIVDALDFGIVPGERPKSGKDVDAARLAKHLRSILDDPEKFAAMHAWRKLPLREEFIRKYNFTKAHGRCRTCRWAIANL